MEQKVSNNWKENIAYIVQKYLNGKNQVQLAKEFNSATNTTIRRILLKNNIPVRGVGIAQRFVNYNPFEDLTKDEVQYWLGYLVADGSITGNKITMYTCLDPSHMQKYITFLSNDKIKLHKTKDKRYDDYYLYSVQFSNKEVVQFLHTLGIVENKSLTMNYKGIITLPFLRGLIDGDGSYIRQNKKGIRINITIGSLVFAHQCKDFLTSLNVKSEVYTHKNVYTLNVNTNPAKQLLKLLYQNAEVYLERKYTKMGYLL